MKDKLSRSPRINSGLERYDIHTFMDVIFHLPSSYLNLNYSNEYELNTNMKITVLGKLVTQPTFFRGPKVTVIRFQIESPRKIIYKVIAYNQPYLLKHLEVGKLYTVHGTINLTTYEITLSKFVQGELADEAMFVPIYRLPQSVKNHEFIRLVNKSFANVKVPQVVPTVLADKNRLLSTYNALYRVHKAKNYLDVNTGLRTLKYEEALNFFTKSLLIRHENSNLRNATKTLVNLKDANLFIKKLPFKLTSEQVSAIREIGLDMNKETLMYRLLQGDVGSGKTVVAFSALYINYLRNAQGAFLAPTDALARQHFSSIKKFFAAFNIETELLVGNLKEAEKKEIKTRLATGEIDIVVGTHALFSDDVNYRNLELVIIDEQHKFGVNQRNKLLNKGEKADLLLLSATPIPQTLANTIYGDLDITTITTFPFAKRDVLTVILKTEKEVFPKINEALKSGEQVYVIAPKISYGEKVNVEQLEEVYFKKYPGQVTSLHGQLSDEEKLAALTAFQNGSKQILIATSVVEVGIDVKNAALMVVYEPMSFGLSSLHQLRGRIGRGGQSALFILVNEEDEEKLTALVTENDGFKIAEIDLTLRGPGELSGIKQSGLPPFNYVNIIKDLNLVKAARSDALYLLENKEDTEIKKYLDILALEIKETARQNG